MPGSIAVSDLTKKHPEWTEHHTFWEQIDLLYRGGWDIKQQAALFLEARPMEPAQVFSKRLARFTYQNILGTAVGWYLSALAKNAPQMFIKNADGASAATDDPFFKTFLADCDRRGTNLVDAGKRWFEIAALKGTSYRLIDLPATDRMLNLRQQRESGALDPYLVNFEPEQVTNWGEDSYGNLSWILIATTQQEQAFAEKPSIIDRWYYFDTTQFRVYESRRDEGTTVAAADGARSAELVSEGPHALAEVKRVPVRRVCLPEGLRLGYRVYPQVLDHLNQDNAFGWALFMANLAVPVITGDYDMAPKISETAYLHLEQGSTFEWSEPAGTSFAVSAERIASLREEIYRQMYLMSQGRSSSATASASSGYAKQMDMQPSTDVLNEFGAVLRAEYRNTLDDVAVIRGRKDVVVDIQGLEFQEHDELAELGAVQTGLDMNLPSDKYVKYMQKRAIRATTRGVAPSTVEEFEKEIDAAPTQSEIDQQLAQQQQQNFENALGTSLARTAMKQAA